MIPGDQAFALALLEQLTTSAQAPVYFVHEGVPVPKARARFGQRRVFTPGKTIAAERDLAWTFAQYVRERPWTGGVALVALFYLPDRRRVDGDNLLKLVKDAGTKAGIWGDDSQVVAHAVTVGLDVIRPRTVVALARTASDLRRA